MATKPGFPGLTSWLLQRLTGLLLVVGLFIHVNVIHFTTEARLIDFSSVTTRLAESPTGWAIFYVSFLLACIYHGLNGIWAIMLDFKPKAGLLRFYLVALWIIGIFFSAYGLFGIFGLVKAGV